MILSCSSLKCCGVASICQYACHWHLIHSWTAFISQPQSVSALWPVPNYTTWSQGYTCVNNLPRTLHDIETAKSQTADCVLWKVSSGWHENYINYSNTTKNNILFIDVSASCRKPSSRLTSGAGRQYVKACPIRGSTGSSPRLDSCCRSSWSILPPLWVCHVWDKLLHTDDRHRKSVLMKASDVKPKRR